MSDIDLNAIPEFDGRENARKLGDWLFERNPRETEPDIAVAALRSLIQSEDRIKSLTAELAKLNAEMPACDGGCKYNDGPQETCSQHGRPVAEVWEYLRLDNLRIQSLNEELGATEALIESLAADLATAHGKIAAVEGLKPTWPRGMYGAPRDMFSRRDLHSALKAAEKGTDQ